MDLEFLQGANLKKVELLAPAGNLEALKAAVESGADAVYLAGRSYGMRTASKNFSLEELSSACKKAHKLNKKVYLTCNTLPRNADIPDMPDFLAGSKF